MSFEADANKYHRPPFAGDDCLEQTKSKFMTYDRFYRCGMSTIAALAVNVLAIPFAVAGNLADFKSPLDNSPMIFELQSGGVETPVVKKFKETGVNDYRGDDRAIADGKKLYTSNCIVCHGADGTGKMGPTIVGKDVVYKQVLTDPGMLAIIYGGASGAMQSFHRRGMKQDEMLRIIAYVRTLDK
jgi:cytochrome c-L